MLSAAQYLAFGSAVAVLFSIAVCQILLALALVALLLSKAPLRLPRIWLPLGLFLLATLVSLASSGDIAAGLPQVRKIYVYSMLLVVFSLFRDLRLIRWLVLCWSALRSSPYWRRICFGATFRHGKTHYSSGLRIATRGH